jgi:hypothetical protein
MLTTQHCHPDQGVAFAHLRDLLLGLGRDGQGRADEQARTRRSAIHESSATDRGAIGEWI